MTSFNTFVLCSAARCVRSISARHDLYRNVMALRPLQLRTITITKKNKYLQYFFSILVYVIFIHLIYYDTALTDMSLHNLTLHPKGLRYMVKLALISIYRFVNVNVSEISRLISGRPFIT